jgi:hypothetical protein
VKRLLDRRGGLPHYFPCARDELGCICCYQFHSLASACIELLSHARSIGVVEKPDFAHARARVRYPLDRVLRKGGDFAFRGPSAQRGSPETWNLADRLLWQGNLRMGRGELFAARARQRILESSDLFSNFQGANCLFGAHAFVIPHPERFLPPLVCGG